MARMTLDQLEIFLSVAEHLHFTHAAEFLYITQPSVSAAVQNLEQHYEIKLFNRIGRRVDLTEAGRTLQQEARKIISQVELTERGLQELNSLQKGELRIGASQTVGSYWLPRFIAKFKRQHPKILIDCTIGNTQDISSGVIVGKYDLGLVEGQVESLENLERKIIGGDRLEIVVGKSHPWFVKTTIAIAKLTMTTWVMREQGSGTRHQFEQALRQLGVNPSDLDVALELRNGEMVKAIVESGNGAAAISNLIVSKELELNTLHAVKVKELNQKSTDADPMIRPFYLLKHRERFQTKVSQVFEDLLTDHDLTIFQVSSVS